MRDRAVGALLISIIAFAVMGVIWAMATFVPHEIAIFAAIAGLIGLGWFLWETYFGARPQE